MAGLRLTRDQLASFLKNFEQIKQFEKLFQLVDEQLDEGGVEAAVVAAGTAQATADEALGLLSFLASRIDSLTTDAAANEALGLIASLADQTESLTGDAAANEALARISALQRQLEFQPPPEHNNSIVTDYIDLTENGPHADKPARLSWNPDDGTMDINLYGGTILQTGQEMHFYAKNTSGATIANGTPVMFTGVVGASGRITFGLAIADGSVSPQAMLGVATQDIANNAFGYVTWFGFVRGFDTTGTPYGEVWAQGDALWFDPATPGTWTNVAPVAPNITTAVAVVINAGPGGSGSIHVRMDLALRLNQLTDVFVAAPANGHVLIYDAVQSRWENNTITPGTNISVTNGAGTVTIALTGTVAVANGGTGATTFTANKLLKGNGTSAISSASITDNAATVTIDSGVGFAIARTAVSSPVAADGNVFSGTYTPTVTGITNVDATTAFTTQFMRVGNTVTVAGAFNVDPTTAGLLTEVGISLPVASNFSGTTSLGGVAHAISTSVGGSISSDSTNDRAHVSMRPTSTANQTWYFTFTYTVI